MARFNMSRRAQLGLGGAVLLGLGAAGGAGAVSLTRPSVEMAPNVATPIARLVNTSGVVTVKGRVAEVFGDRVVLQDASGRTMIDAGRDARGTIAKGAALTVQGRYDDGQLRASYLVDPAGKVSAVGPGGRGSDGRGPHGRRGPGGPGGPGHDGPPPPPPGGPELAGRDAPPPPVGCAPGAAQPAPVAGAVPPAPPVDAGTPARR
ncbi:hypothetical protein M9980_08920 [Sphingomonas donggukensis]|uniref:Bacterial OB-fold domain-containing protein n=1 Tax=Sphingomonas donggukensis TaxID=2949093 RepID=A0ABY4TWL4_9SPHN|nr:hypothetical protein [Sphingomonas donggukensis]URW74698.1 hypothetical protein M9980_08920 [Sphingomonas donggukensis]